MAVSASHFDAREYRFLFSVPFEESLGPVAQLSRETKV